MKIVFSKHATEMLTQRNISKEKVETTIENPDKILNSRENKQIFIKDFGNNFLKVIIAEEKSVQTVITLYWFAKKRLKK